MKWHLFYPDTVWLNQIGLCFVDNAQLQQSTYELTCVINWANELTAANSVCTALLLCLWFMQHFRRRCYHQFLTLIIHLKEITVTAESDASKYSLTNEVSHTLKVTHYFPSCSSLARNTAVTFSCVENAAFHVSYWFGTNFSVLFLMIVAFVQHNVKQYSPIECLCIIIAADIGHKYIGSVFVTGSSIIQHLSFIGTWKHISLFL